ncbi:MAG TPA: carbon-nitrogen hydrolase family protein [Caulobacteraceae bacterium]|jgi:predicted amidohydrolase|nr:carbon-nitrogen hydrolase family protein [Caulobacteraceae bacterium]
MRPFGVAGLQLDLPMRDNADRITAEIAMAKRVYPWIDMILLGELSWFGPDLAAAQPLPGPLESRMCRMARDAGVWLVAGSLYERDGDAIYNTCPIINPAGEVVARCRKLYPFTPYERGVASGEAVTVFEVPGVGKFGVSICYDMWFPETLRTMAWLGAEVILHPSMTNTIDRDVETAIARAGAATNQVYFFDLNVVGVGGGRSGVYGPGGEVIHAAGVGREIICVEFDLDYVARVRDRGWHGLGQVLKTWRDGDIAFPAYAQGARASGAFERLGPLVYPTAGLSTEGQGR